MNAVTTHQTVVMCAAHNGRPRTVQRTGVAPLSYPIDAVAAAQSQRVTHPLDAAVQVYRGTHGIFFGDDLALLMRTQEAQPISRLARAIVAREVLAFDWRSSIVLPRFQFDTGPMAVRPGVAAALRELAPVLDDVELALWFVQENAWLEGARPIDVVDRGGGAALRHAARADRFVATGA
jgi:hypothetical protein